MFSAAIATLGLKGAILIFPEGVSHSEPTLMPLRTGAARMLLGAEALAGGRLGVTLLPVGLIFHEPGSFRTGWALVLVGDPVPTGDFIVFTITYRKGHGHKPEGTLLEGQTVKVKEGMIFNVTATDKS